MNVSSEFGMIGLGLNSTSYNKAFHKGNFSQSSPHNDTSDRNLIPSPPGSPSLGRSHLNALSSSPLQIASVNDFGIFVTPSWEKGLQASHYQTAARRFLLQYRYARKASNNKKGSQKKAYSRRNLRNSAASGDLSDGNSASKKRRVYPTRNRTIKDPESPEKLRVTYKQQSHTIYDLHASWDSIPDYSPPLSSLSSMDPDRLLVEWKGLSLDPSEDPLRHNLHPIELQLAQTLRLSCMAYLDSKRRLFSEKVDRMSRNLTFKRTDAQRACMIDVNKASRLFTAYEELGWLDDSYFRPYLKIEE